MRTTIILSNIKNNPKRIFLLDSAGALITTIGLVLILIVFEPYFGMPRNALYLLSAIAFSLFTYSISCYFLVKKNWNLYLLILMVGNTLYALVSIVLIIKNFDQLTILGILYFTSEKIIIALIVNLEYQAYLKINSNYKLT